MVTGWSYLVASNGVPASCISCTSAFPLEVTRSETCILAPDISGASGTVTTPSHSPARLFKVVKDFCASDGVVATSAAKAVAATRRNKREIAMRDFMLILSLFFTQSSPRQLQEQCCYIVL